MKKIISVILIVIILWFIFDKDETVVLGPGVKAPDIPIQKKLTDAKSFTKHEFKIIPLASFKIKAKVLARENYSKGREGKLSPVDFAFGWGRMSDESVLEKISISQSNRWYRWRAETFPIPKICCRYCD